MLIVALARALVTPWSCPSTCAAPASGQLQGLALPVAYARRNFLVPIPRFESFGALNDHLEARCRERQAAKLRGHEETIVTRMARDRVGFLPLPSAPYDACDKRPGRVTSLSLVRYKGNDYSVPVARLGQNYTAQPGYPGVR